MGVGYCTASYYPQDVVVAAAVDDMMYALPVATIEQSLAMVRSTELARRK
jgi:hypothetical protein